MTIPDRLPTLPQRPAFQSLSVLDWTRIAALAALVAAGVLTPGFLSKVSLLSMLTAASFTGCVAIGMTFITMGGNLVSFSLGITLSVTTIVFTASLPLGLAAAVTIALCFAAAIQAVQGCIVGFFRANPIIVSLAALSCTTGAATWWTGGRGVYPQDNQADILRGTIGVVPVPVVACAALAVIGSLVLARTTFGRRLILTGSNRQAAEVAGASPATTTIVAYLLAGIATGVAAILMAARYRSGDLEIGGGYDYSAIAAVLVGGTPIQGGGGSPLRTLFGALGISVIEALLVLQGFSTQWQFLVIGLLVLLAVILQSRADA